MYILYIYMYICNVYIFNTFQIITSDAKLDKMIEQIVK